ncbi:SpoIIE family protein phosphatase [Pontiella sp.]|uniref:SpoIIE family protein phosphatase n=1 Tax=Pontiella sp. TaxID=2837462 RepID=UPI003567FE28
MNQTEPTAVPDHQFLFENLMGNLTDAIYFKDLESRFIRVNKACADKHRWHSPEAIIGKTDFDTFTREHAEKAFADEQRIIQTGEPLDSVEERETWPDGSVTWASTIKMPLRDESGRIVGTFGISRDITEHKLAELRALRYSDEIRSIKEEMENDVRMAGQLQKNFAPGAYPSFAGGGCVDFLHRFNLNRQVSGDYCAITQISDHEAGVFLCDIGGAGVRAALGTALVRGIMQEIGPNAADPGAFLARMNGLLLPLINQEGLSLDVTACYIVLDARSGTVRFANAGHPMPIHFHDGHSAKWLREGCDHCIGDPLGLNAGSAYTTVERRLEPNDAVVLFTDGLYSVCNNLQDPYGKKRLLDSAHSLAGEPLQDIFDGLENDALAFAKERRFSDDVCLVGFQFHRPMD